MVVAQFEKVAQDIRRWGGPIDDLGGARDAEFGGRVVNTSLGPVTRMWLDSNVEYHFIRRHLGTIVDKTVLDIGAGYGRFAVSIIDYCKGVTCVDAVPISTAVCCDYVKKFRPVVEVLSIQEFIEAYPRLKFDLAVNIHSWNECTLEQVTNWLNVLGEMRVPYLFTVSHGTYDSAEKPYYSWNHGQPSYRPAIELRYDLVAEESIGLTGHPHALWKLK
jgi:hypothetical protein